MGGTRRAGKKKKQSTKSNSRSTKVPSTPQPKAKAPRDRPGFPGFRSEPGSPAWSPLAFDRVNNGYFSDPGFPPDLPDVPALSSFVVLGKDTKFDVVYALYLFLLPTIVTHLKLCWVFTSAIARAPGFNDDMRNFAMKVWEKLKWFDLDRVPRQALIDLDLIPRLQLAHLTIKLVDGFILSVLPGFRTDPVKPEAVLEVLDMLSDERVSTTFVTSIVEIYIYDIPDDLYNALKNPALPRSHQAPQGGERARRKAKALFKNQAVKAEDNAHCVHRRAEAPPPLTSATDEASAPKLRDRVFGRNSFIPDLAQAYPGSNSDSDDFEDEGEYNNNKIDYYLRNGIPHPCDDDSDSSDDYTASYLRLRGFY